MRSEYSCFGSRLSCCVAHANCRIAELPSLKHNKSLRRVDQRYVVEAKTVEALLTHRSKMVGRSIEEMRLCRRFGVSPFAMHRRNHNIGCQLDDLVVSVGDTFLLEGAEADIHRLAHGIGLINVAQTSVQVFRWGQAPIAIAVVFCLSCLPYSVWPRSFCCLFGCCSHFRCMCN